jgi:hypothetical protein
MVALAAIMIGVLAIVSLPLAATRTTNSVISSSGVNSTLLGVDGVANASTTGVTTSYTYTTTPLPIAPGACEYTATPSPGDWNNSRSWKVSADAPSRVPNPIPSGCTVVIPAGPSSCLSKNNATSGCAVDIPKGLTVVNHGTLETGDYLWNNGTLVNLGTVDIFHGELWNGVFGTITNNGTLDCNCELVNQNRITNGAGGVVVATGGGVVENGGLITNELGGTMFANDSGQVQNDGGLLDNAGNVTINQGGEVSDVLGGNMTNFNTGLVTNMGALTNNDTLANYGTLNNAASGTLTNSLGAFIENNGTLVNRGLIVNQGTISNNRGVVENLGTISGSGSVTGLTVPMAPEAWKGNPLNPPF